MYMEAYFKLMKDNFKFLKEIDTNFKKFKQDIIIEKPSLAITLSLDYLGRPPDNWSEVTNFIYEQSGNNYLLFFEFILIFFRWKSRYCEYD